MSDANTDEQSGQKPVALVTGGAGGIGAACCRALSAAGYCVGIHFRKSREPAEQVLSEIRGQGFLLQADIADPDAVEAMLSRLKEEQGRVDVLVNNAGICINESMLTMKLDAFDQQRSVLRGAWYLTRRVLRMFMLRRRQGRIINISSVVGHSGNAGQVPYTMEKAALDAMTKSLAKELAGRNILVNSVAPGFIDTEMTGALPEEHRQAILSAVPLGRMGQPGEVAEVVAFLAVGGSYINGTVIHVNGGMYGG
ncbi:MAG TPA: 3-oxoacyl-ACP reductase family protein [Desulfosalsimonadaceae bacterium]|nr:3-oxoacyl-ACP reductase family protein [Desulfosalsimonadaceae bacterium]